MRLKAFAIGLLLALAASSSAFAQCSGNPPAGRLCANGTGAAGLPSWYTQSVVLDRNFGAPSGQGTILNRGASLWSATVTPSLGLNGTAGGSLTLNGSSTGSAVIGVKAAAGTTVFNLPVGNGSMNNVLATDGSGNTSWASLAGVGTVTSVGLALPSSILTVSGSPVTTTGTLTGTLATQSANAVWVGPTTGAAATPTFRSLVGADLPNPTSGSLGGIESLAAVSHQWINQISTSGVPTATQPAFTDISGTATTGQIPTTTTLLDVVGSTQGDVLYRGASVWTALTPGTSGRVLTSGGAAANPSWAAVANSSLAQMPADTVKCNPTGSTAAAQDCTDPVVSGVTISTTATGTSSFPGPGINETITGPSSATAVTSNVFYNQTLISNGANATNGNPVAGYYVALTSGGPNANSSIYGEWIDVMHTSGSVQNGDHVGSVPRCILSAAVTGTGGCFGAAPAAWVQSGGSMNAITGEATGMECDSRIDAGGSAAWHFGCGAISNGAVSGTLLDGAFEIGSAVAGGEWKNGIILNSGHGAAAISSTGCLICTDGVAKTIASGIDLSAYSVTNTFIAGPGDHFVVDPSGNITATNLTAPWSAYTATVTPGAGSITTQSSDSTVLQAGKWVRTEIHVTVSSIGTGSGTVTINLPVAVKHAGETCIGRESGVSGFVLSGSVGSAGTTAMQLLKYDNTAPAFSNGVIYNFTCNYEAS